MSYDSIVVNSDSKINSDLLAMFAKAQAMKPKPIDKRSFIDANELLSWPDPTWLVEGMIPDSGLGMIYGPPASLKSFLTIEILLSLAHGKPVLGRFDTNEVPVAYIAPEGTAGIKHRLQSWMAANGIEKLRNVIINPHAFSLNDDDEIKAVIEHITASPIKPRLLVIDTLARNFRGDENSTKDMTSLVNCVMEIVAKKIAVIFVHHTGKDRSRGARGSIALTGAVDFSIELERMEGELSSTVHCRKMKDAEEFKSFVIRGNKVNESLSLSYDAPAQIDKSVVKIGSVAPIIELLPTTEDDALKFRDIKAGSGLTEMTARRYLDLATKQGYVVKSDSYPPRYWRDINAVNKWNGLQLIEHS